MKIKGMNFSLINAMNQPNMGLPFHIPSMNVGLKSKELNQGILRLN